MYKGTIFQSQKSILSYFNRLKGKILFSPRRYPVFEDLKGIDINDEGNHVGIQLEFKQQLPDLKRSHN